MALIKCPECGREVSDKALSCPNCGYPISQDPLEWAMDFETYPLVQASEQRETQPLGEKNPSSDKTDCGVDEKKKNRRAVLIFAAIMSTMLALGIISDPSRGMSHHSPTTNTSSTSASTSASSAGSSNSSSSQSSSSKYSSDEIMAGVYALAEKCVKSHLKSPSSAKLCSMSDCEFQKGEDGVYMMAGTVESENSYGAMLKETWGIMAQVDGDKVSLVMVQIGDQGYFD